VDHLLRAPDLDELRTFCVAAELGTLGRAATRLHVTQPAVSKRLRHLEDRCGVRLLDRSGHGVTLTAPGERLYPSARRVVDQMAEVAAVVDELRGRCETVTLAISPTASELLLSPALVRLETDGNAPVEVLVANSRMVKRMVGRGEVQVGVAACAIGEEVPGATSVVLFEDEIVLAAPLSHPWARRRRITARELAATPVVRRDPGAQTRQILDAAMETAGSSRPIAAIEVGTTEAAKHEAHSRGIPAVMSRFAITPADNLEAVRVDGVPFRRHFCALLPAGEPRPPAAVERLVEALRATGLELT
jgi:DNA-binding transcriptional LysR family regulator